MIEDYKEEVKRLIKKGEFELDLISFEYGIPMDIILNWKKELDEEKELSKKKDKPKKDTEVYKKANDIIMSYNSLYNGDSRKKDAKEKRYRNELSGEQMAAIIKKQSNKINGWIENLKEEQSSEEKAETVKNIVKEILSMENVQNLQLPIEIVDAYIGILFSKQIQEIGNNELRRLLDRAKGVIGIQLARTIDAELEEINDIDSLKKLSARITPELLKGSMLLNSSKLKISNKIIALQRANRNREMQYNISPKEESIIIGLTEGNLDIDMANYLIDKLAKERNSNRPKSKFAFITEEQERKQILMQIKNIIKEQGEKYPIKNVDDSITQIMKLCNISIDQAVTIVVEQKIKLKEYEEAKNICSKYNKGTPETVASINLLLKRIKVLEKSDIILKGIKKEATPDEEEKFFEIISQELAMEKSMGTIRLGAINLGMNKLGTRKITFGDVWSGKSIDGNER